VIVPDTEPMSLTVLTVYGALEHALLAITWKLTFARFGVPHETAVARLDG
jgi:hypothetical protein